MDWHRPPAPSASLCGVCFDVPEVGLLTLSIASESHLAQADRIWPQERRPNDLHDHWRWLKIMNGKRERFSILHRADSRVVALWCSEPKGPRHIESGRFYRLDYLEVAPRHRQTSVGLFVLALVACRALEVGASGLVLGGFPIDGVHRFYTEAGGVQRDVRGWKPARDLIPYIFERSALEWLKDFADGFLDES